MNDSGQTRNLVWQNQLDLMRGERYFHAMLQKFKKRHAAIRWFLGFAGLGVASPLIPPVPDYIPAFAGIAVVALIILDFVKDYGGKVAAFRSAYQATVSIGNLHRALWDEINTGSIDDETARKSTIKLYNDAQILTQSVDIEFDDSINVKCEEQTYEVEKRRYAAG